jgi:hypothetical protein
MCIDKHEWPPNHYVSIHTPPEPWADRTVGGLTRALKVSCILWRGRIELTYQTFDVTGAPGQQLLVGTPEPGSSAAAITRLADADRKELA